MYIRKKNYILYSGVIFLAVGAMHAARVFYGWNLTIDTWVAPMWVSWAAAVVALYLAFSAYKMSQ